jgi:hypothetical protein
MGHRLGAGHVPALLSIRSTRLALQAVALMVLATISLAACAAVNEAVTGRHLTCLDTPDDICVRAADLTVDDLITKIASDEVMAAALGNVRASEMTVVVKPTDCADIGRGPVAARHPAAPDHAPATRCWRVEGEHASGNLAFGRWVYEDQHGTLVVTG